MRKPSTSSKKKPKKPKKTYTIAQLIAMGDTAMESLDVPQAMDHYHEAVTILQQQQQHQQQQEETHSNDLAQQAYAKLAECQVAMGDPDSARDSYETAISLTPEGRRATLYFYLGQVSLEEEALEAHEKGIAELKQAMDLCKLQHHEREERLDQDDTVDSMNDDDDGTAGPNNQLEELKLLLVRAHCTVAELYLTDLCFADGAEQECERHVNEAMSLTSTPQPEALQVLTSLRLSQRQESSGEGGATAAAPSQYILQVYDSMKEGCEELAKLVGLNTNPKDNDEEEEEGEAAELQNVDAVNNLPGFEFRCQTAKLLLECAALSEKEKCVQAAIQVLGSLLAENDEVIELFFLLGCAFEMMGPEQQQAAIEYWEQAMVMLTKVQQSLRDEEDEDDEDVIQQLNECEQQMQDIQNKLQRIKEEGADVADEAMEEES